MAYLRKKIFKFHKYNDIMFRLLISISIILSKKPNINNTLSEITLTIKGSGNNIKILSDTKFCGDRNKYIQFKSFPDRVIINNETQNFTGIFVNLTKEINIVKLQWDNPITDCKIMFDRVYNIINFDFSKFDTSLVTDMRCMFCESNAMTSLDITNFNTSLVTDMRSMFNKCYSLITLNLSNFDTSKVTDLYHMFNNCTSLISLNVNNFNLKSSGDIGYMFENCSSLISLDLTSFDTQKVMNAITGIFQNANKYLILKINTTDISTLKNKFQNFKINNNSTCFLNNHKLIKEKKDCIENCMSDDDYKYDYNEICFLNCPNDTFYFNNSFICIKEIEDGYYNKPNSQIILKCDEKCKSCSYESIQKNLCLACNTQKNFYPIYDDLNNIYMNCYKNNIEGYYLDNDSYAYKPCYNKCKTCSKSGDKNNNNCLSCTSNFSFYDYNNSNCYKNCEFYYYLDDSNSFRCTNNSECPNGYKLIYNKSKCIKNCYEDDYYKYELNNECVHSCPEGKAVYDDNYICQNEKSKITIVKEMLFNFNKSNTNNKTENKEIIEPEVIDNIISNIENQITNGDMDNIIDSIIEGEEDIVIDSGNIQFQITSTSNQNNMDYNISSISLGECEKRLKQIYNLEPNITLLIFKIDYFPPNSLIPIIGYKIYEPNNKTELNLTHCKKVNLSIPVNIDEKNLYKYNPNDEYYNDECIPSTTENGKDILLKDRHNEYNNNNMSICEKSCEFIKYDEINKKSICNCQIKNEQINVTNIANQSNILSYDFGDTDSYSNSMKCYKILFTKEGLISNVGSYILLFTILFFLLSVIIFIKCGFYILNEEINKILNYIKKKEKNNKNNKNKLIDNKKEDAKNKKIIKKKKGKKNKNKNDNKNIRIKKGGNEVKNKQCQNMIKHNNIIGFNIINNNASYKNMLSKKKSSNNKKDNTNKERQLNDFELNTLQYKQALIIDKRSFGDFYISLIKQKQPLIFCFMYNNDFNLRIIKICLFFLSYSIYYLINFVFINENTIHEIYEDDNKYNFVDIIPQLFIRFTIAHFICIVIRYFSLSERNIKDITLAENSNSAYYIIENVKKCLKIKYTLFFGLGNIFLFFMWYYLSSFGAVYQNTQYYLVKNASICFAISFFYPFFISIFPSMFRNCAMSSKNGECLYKVNQILQLL